MHLFDIDVPGKIRFQESEVLSPGNELMTFDTGVCSVCYFSQYLILFPGLARVSSYIASTEALSSCMLYEAKRGGEEGRGEREGRGGEGRGGEGRGGEGREGRGRKGGEGRGRGKGRGREGGKGKGREGWEGGEGRRREGREREGGRRRGNMSLIGYFSCTIPRNVIFTSCNLCPLHCVMLYCNVGWCVKGSAVHHSYQQCLVAEWLGLSVIVRVKLRARAREW